MWRRQKSNGELTKIYFSTSMTIFNFNLFQFISISITFNLFVTRRGDVVHNGRKSLILAPQEIPDISGYQWGFGRRFVKAYNTENTVTNQKIL